MIACNVLPPKRAIGTPSHLVLHRPTLSYSTSNTGSAAVLSLASIKRFCGRNKSELLACCILPVSISNHRLVYCEVFCIWKHVNPKITKVVIIFFLDLLFFSENRKCFCFSRCWILLITVTAYRGKGLATPRKSSTCATLL